MAKPSFYHAHTAQRSRFWSSCSCLISPFLINLLISQQYPGLSKSVVISPPSLGLDHFCFRFTKCYRNHLTGVFTDFLQTARHNRAYSLWSSTSPPLSINLSAMSPTAPIAPAPLLPRQKYNHSQSFCFSPCRLCPPKQGSHALPYQ